ncbi:DUF5615 family PIN-like protein [Salinigranum halophilum]|uniref:DUF5615 family PIN-like protein n=1 Tax=Salinigranum halophilum TaxID=2565931 RepID=UPI0010A7FA2F|nr:DUF5615 family PIN-like protein [Salinigranum halophilum]
MSIRTPSERREWRFLLDENIDPKTATHLEKEGIHAEHLRDALWQGADDEADVLPYAREHRLIIVTSDVMDFGGLPLEAHAGLVLLYDDMMPAYQNRESFGGHEELDPWVEQTY